MPTEIADGLPDPSLRLTVPGGRASDEIAGRREPSMACNWQCRYENAESQDWI